MVLKSIDLIGANMQLTINTKYNFKSGIGGVMTISIVIIFIGTFIGFGNDIIFKSKPKVTFNRIKNQAVPYYEMTDHNFLFTIYDQYSDEHFPQFDRMFTIYYDYIYFKGNGTIEAKYKFGVEKCGQKAIELKKNNFTYDPKTYFCFPLNSRIPLEGSKGAYSLIRLQVDYCQNNTDINNGPIKTDCLPLEEAKRLASKSRIQMNYLIDNIIIDTSKFSHPFINNVDSDSINTDANSWSRMQILMKQIMINTDVGFIFETIEQKVYSGIDSIRFESFYSPNSTTIFSHLFVFSDWLEVYDREYIKIQDILAMMGGFINFSLIVLKYFIYYITRTQIIDIFNNNYHFSFMKCHEKPENKFPIKYVSSFNK